MKKCVCEGLRLLGLSHTHLKLFFSRWCCPAVPAPSGAEWAACSWSISGYGDSMEKTKGGCVWQALYTKSWLVKVWGGLFHPTFKRFQLIGCQMSVGVRH